MKWLIRGLHVVMALVFALCIAVQLNDPDAVPWIAVYAAALILCVTGAAGAPLRWQAAVVATFAFVWGLTLSPAVPVYFDEDTRTTFYMHTGDDVEEEARECGGLMIVTAWSLVVLADANARRRRLPSRSAS